MFNESTKGKKMTKKEKARLHEEAKEWLQKNIKENETIYYCVGTLTLYKL